MYFSVIVTVYKVEAYLRTCVDSVLAQTFGDFELILVDDGSPDGCPAICDEYAKTDERVKVIHQENKGVARARKNGLSASCGAYIVFVDGDDWIAAHFLERGYAYIAKEHPDLILSACSYEYEGFSKIVREPVEAGLYEKAAARRTIYPVLLMNGNMKHMFYFVHGKIFSRSLAEKYIMPVDDGIFLGEDLLCVIPACLEAERIYVSHEVFDYYRVRGQSGSHSFLVEHYRQLQLVMQGLGKLQACVQELPVDFDRQIERYVAFMSFTFMNNAVNFGKLRQLREIEVALQSPGLKECLRRAQFQKVTPKTRIAFAMLKKEMFLETYLFLWMCRQVKAFIKIPVWFKHQKRLAYGGGKWKRKR